MIRTGEFVLLSSPLFTQVFQAISPQDGQTWGQVCSVRVFIQNGLSLTYNWLTKRQGISRIRIFLQKWTENQISQIYFKETFPQQMFIVINVSFRYELLIVLFPFGIRLFFKDFSSLCSDYWQADLANWPKNCISYLISSWGNTRGLTVPSVLESL